MEQLIDFHGVLLSSCRSTRWYQINWCTEQFGVDLKRWFQLQNYIYFRNESDFTWYLLKWG